MWFLVGGISFSSWCLGKTALFYCGTPLVFKNVVNRMTLYFPAMIWFTYLRNAVECHGENKIAMK